MLLIKVQIDRSPIHGLGVFAAAPVAIGQAVWQFTPGFDLDADPSLLANLPELWRERLLHYGYIDQRLRRFILCCDDTRFLNHSDEPTLAADYRENPYGIDRATRDLAIGEELTVNYQSLEVAFPVRTLMALPVG